MKQNVEMHSCYDELLSMLFLNDIKQINTNDKYVMLLDGQSLTAHEVLLYSLLLHKCIEDNSEKASISYREIQTLRNKRCGATSLLDEDTYMAYNTAFRGLCTKRLKYDLGNNTKRTKITYERKEQPVILVYDRKKQNNRDTLIHYSLGAFGMTLLESRRYSTLVPNKFFQVNFNEIMTYELALYICRIIYMNRRKKSKQITIKLESVMRNTNKYMIENNKLTKVSSCLEYNGPNIKRLWDLIASKVNQVLEQLKVEYKIEDYIIQGVNSGKDYTNTKWKVLLNK